MIQHLDRMLERLILNEGVVKKMSFEPPVDAWRGTLDPADETVVNAYLVDLHEKREMRQSGEVMRPNGHFGSSERLPAFLECHYLLSAWTAADDAAAVLSNAGGAPSPLPRVRDAGPRDPPQRVADRARRQPPGPRADP